VGALPSEVAIMESLTANLHFLMASFYKPTKERYKIILEGKAFPSDHYAVGSQIRHHSLDPAEAMILISPPEGSKSPLLRTDHILNIIDTHAESTALLLLPGVQFYTGQYFDIPTITTYAQERGITVGWDLAHAVGNVPLQLHDWNVDFAAWCNYKYMNCGPGAIGGLFVHEKHGQVDETSGETKGVETGYTPRLAGWWGSSKSTRFAMTNQFSPIPGAAGWQVSNPSAIDTSAVLASLEVFGMTDIASLREKSLKITGYLEDLLLATSEQDRRYEIITPKEQEQRGAQLSVKLEEGLLDTVMEFLEEEGVVVDERRPDVIRVAPAPLYNTYEDCWNFVSVFREAIKKAKSAKDHGKGGSVLVQGGMDKGAWSDIK
jgi:kynureninase